MLKRILTAVLLGVAVGVGGFYLLTMPDPLDAETFPREQYGDPVRGERMFWAGGCASCHAPSKAEAAAKLELGGGDPLKTDFGSFRAPNISSHPTDGIGSWSLADFANAMQRGIDPDGEHLYPAFPYSSYVKMKPGDIADLWAFLKTLPPVAGQAPPSDLAFPFNIRRGIGLWKRFFLDDAAPVVDLGENASDAVRAGQYLVEGPGHCGQCHTPRGLGGAGGLDADAWLTGAPNPEGKGRIPDITPSKDGIGSWSTSDIVYYLESGFTPDFDSAGGAMVAVQENIARLPATDREAIAAYLKALPAVASAGK